MSFTVSGCEAPSADGHVVSSQISAGGRRQTDGLDILIYTMNLNLTFTMFNLKNYYYTQKGRGI